MNRYSYDGGYNGGDGMDQGDANDMMMTMHEENNMNGGQSLDDIVNQNDKVIRRQSLPQHYGANSNRMDAELRHMSMMDYNGGSAGAMNRLQYIGGAGMGQSGMMMGNSSQNQQHEQMSNPPSRENTGGDISINTNFNPAQHNYGSMNASPAYGQSPVVSSRMDMSMASPYHKVDLSMDYLDPGMGNPISADTMNMNFYDQGQFTNASMTSPMHQQMSQLNNQMAMGPTSHDIAGQNDMGTSYGGTNGNETNNDQATQRESQRQSAGISNSSTPQTQSSGSQSTQTITNQQTPQQTPQQTQPRQQALQRSHASRLQQMERPAFSSGPQNSSGVHEDSSKAQSQQTQTFDGKNGPIAINSNNTPAVKDPNGPWETPEGGWPSTMNGNPHTTSKFNNAYSSTGFDMLGVLMRVSTRQNAEINIGTVDLSCSFVVCDVERDDVPIVYCSENFERLTGYTKHMILGRNCRFLQSPDGNVAAGVRRKYVDDDSILYLKNMIKMRREAQLSVINYRRGGQPFMNLLTMIPVAWEGDTIKYYVGFQVDLVEQPNAVTNKNPDGSYVINYQRGVTMPRYIIPPPNQSQKTDLGQTVPRDDVSAILATINSAESDYTKRMWDKVLLENTDDVVHVLSLKGIFQWISPSAARVLEYEPREIVGTALSSVCHPSDIVPVTRELKDTSSGSSVNVVFRIRRKNSGYMWFEGHGSLHTEQSKGRKSIIMVGRERPVYTLSKKDIAAAGGIGENELWSKMSTSGMFLFISQNVRQLLDRQPEELVGVSIQSLMRTDSKMEFGRILEHARTGKLASVKHEMINKRGQVLSAFTTLYPGDASEGQKPTFIVAQTRLLKFARASQPGRPATNSKHERSASESMEPASPSLSFQPPTPGNATPSSVTMSNSRFISTDGAAMSYSGHQGLVIGNQDQSLASDENLFDELKTTKPSSWQYEIRQLERRNRLLAEEVQALLAAKKKRKRRKGAGNTLKDCANCHTKSTPEWRRGPSGERDLCNSCGLRWAKLNSKVSPRTKSKASVTGAGPLSTSHKSILDSEMQPSAFENKQAPKSKD